MNHAPAAAVEPARKTKTLLLTIIGSAAAPSDQSLWQETYVRSLAELGAAEPAARQAIARAVSAGWFTGTREGKRTRLTVTPAHRTGLLEASQRVDRFGRPASWSGEWLVLILSVPEQARSIRNRFRTQLGWLGFGSLGNGVWISPHAHNEPEIRELLSSAEGIGDTHLFRSAVYGGADPAHLTTAAWDIPSLQRRYDAFLARFETSEPATDAAMWTEWIELVTSWRHFPLVDPELPEHLLPAGWPRARARQLFTLRDETWRPRALAHLADIERSILL